jgi:hypothetical protein
MLGFSNENDDLRFRFSLAPQRAGMKRALLVSPYFIPSNLASVHRARIMASPLPRCRLVPLSLNDVLLEFLSELDLSRA